MDRTLPKLVTIFGGSGFVGTHLVQILARQGYRIRVAVRRPDLAGKTRIFGNVGQVMPIQANLRNADSVRRAVEGADIVINLVGVGHEKGPQSFEAVHVQGAALVAQLAKQAGVSAFVHMSALGVDKAADVSLYAASKFRGEQAVLAAFPEAVVMRPGLIFGQGDGFFNLMGTLARMFPVMPLISGKTLFQPVFVGDVAEAFAQAAEGKVKTGRVYELGGPDVESHKALMERILREAGRKRPLVPFPSGLAKLGASILGILPTKPLVTGDQVELLGVDNVVSEEAIRDKRTLAAFGIVPTSMDAILPTYMWRFRRHGEFDRDDKSQSGGSVAA
ncbi:complex I NDUFA9 subunit family protein [Devosia chinhatensis]|uniref:3-beta hydroxysteroid dehydrogenase n=1 Tax=Devosia chinhatensis TaxID=429727 RepID=A0A0F5FG66_9HYPH|nr:complex I NDUFA9 subunit family protein [Devosia chinhatensis]KKB07899.1 3-beta hydroxysteroid dehydrogenase [Devosia chinhatensis]